MGIQSFVRQYLKSKYGKAFSFSPPGDVTVVIKDLMEHMQTIPEASINSLDDLLQFHVNIVKSVLYSQGNRIHTMHILVDREPPPVKRMIEHKERYKKIDMLPAEGAPYLPVKGSDVIPNPWIRFSSNFRLRQREYFPRLFNVLMDERWIMPRPGQKIVLHGFPGYSEYVRVYSQKKDAFEGNARGEILQIHRWNPATELPITPEMEERDPDLYNRVYMFQHVPPCSEWPQGLILPFCFDVLFCRLIATFYFDVLF